VNAYDTVVAAAADAAVDTIRKLRSGEIRSADAAEENVRSHLSGILDFLMPTLSSEAQAVLAPATQQAIDAMKPAMYQVLQDWTPTFAAIVGGMAGLAILLGVHVSQRTYARSRRNPARRRRVA
jgi:hypothetical protein